MNIKQARKRLELLGFTFPLPLPSAWGRKVPEKFETEFHILETPIRDIYFAEAKGGWYVTSHIYFQARRFRARQYNTFKASILNIFGYGATLEEAIGNFAYNFNSKIYNLKTN